jgi:ACS family allantoate permease-like MFS transporter
MGFTNFISSILLVPFGAMETIALITSGYITHKWPNMRCFMQFATIAPSVMGAALVYYLPADQKAGRLVGFSITGMSNAGLPLQFSLISSNVAGHTKRQISSAIMFLGYATGFIIGPQFFLSSESPAYPTGFKTMIITFAVAAFAPLGLWVYLTWLNGVKETRLVESGGDVEYMRNEEFLDLTDREQIHFRYSK